jgi:hypothetical protein
MLMEKVKISGMCSQGEQTFQRLNTNRKYGCCKDTFSAEKSAFRPEKYRIFVPKSRVSAENASFQYTASGK